MLIEVFSLRQKSAIAEKLGWNDIYSGKNLISSEFYNSLSLCADNIFTFHTIFINSLGVIYDIYDIYI